MLRKAFLVVIIAAGTLTLSAGCARAKASCEDDLARLDELLTDDAGLSENEFAMFEGLRDAAARQCRQGNTTAASQMLQGLISRLSDEANPKPAEPEGLPKARLTVDYLEGIWCTSWAKSPERVQYLFAADGSFKIGMLAGEGYGYMESEPGLAGFYDRFESLDSKDEDRFVVVDQHGSEIVYEKGPCPTPGL